MTTADPPLAGTGTGTGSHALTGIAGLDDVLAGGLTVNRLYLIEGVPGSGKTTLAMQFLLEGARRGERGAVRDAVGAEGRARAVAASHGWSLDGINIRELSASEREPEPDDQYTMFHPSEVELARRRRPSSARSSASSRRAWCSTRCRSCAARGNALRYRRQILALKQFFSGADAP
jgi:circadian clock protein KaiC